METWLRSADGGAIAIGAGEALPRALVADDCAALEVACKLERPFDLSASGLDPALRRLAEQYGFAIGCRLVSRDGEPRGAIWLRGPLAGDRVPQLLGECAAAAMQLRDPLSAWRSGVPTDDEEDNSRRLHRLALLGDLIAEAVHEIRNPLVAIKTFLQLLPGHETDPDFTGEFRQLAVDELARLERLLEALASHAHPNARAATSSTDVLACVSSIEGLLAHRAREQGIALHAQRGGVDGDDPGDRDALRAAIDVDSLRQVLLNLVLNAIEATPHGGSITLSAAREAGGVSIVIDDAGSGVPYRDRSRVFEPRFSTRREGAGGLGLSITARLVREAHGSIEVRESPQGGARFAVWLPSA